MDYVSHGLWSYIIFHRIRTPLLAVCFGLLPDTLSWVIYGIYRLITHGEFGKPVLDEIPDWAFLLYDISHSLVVALAVIAIIFIVLRRVPVYIFAWPLMIIIDALTHTRAFLPTPFLWPVSDWTFPGISWATPWFLVLNYALITVGLTLIIYYKRKKKPKPLLHQ